METLEHAYGKINLSLDILQKRPDGFHDLCMLMETICLSDTVHIRLRPGNGISISSNLGFLPNDKRNLAYRAAQLFFSSLALPPWQVSIHLEKNIPVGAGLAGGSSNAAAVLRGLNRLLDTKLSGQQLAQMGLSLGSDVPYCVLGGTQLAQGRGEVLVPLPSLPPCHIVLSKPPFSIATKNMFARVDVRKIRHRPDTAGIIAALEQQDLDQVAVRMYNVFEPALLAEKESVLDIKNTLLDFGAKGAVMTGTGSGVFGLFTQEEKAQAAYAALGTRYTETFLTKNLSTPLV